MVSIIIEVGKLFTGAVMRLFGVWKLSEVHVSMNYLLYITKIAVHLTVDLQKRSEWKKR